MRRRSILVARYLVDRVLFAYALKQPIPLAIVPEAPSENGRGLCAEKRRGRFAKQSLEILAEESPLDLQNILSKHLQDQTLLLGRNPIGIANQFP